MTREENREGSALSRFEFSIPGAIVAFVVLGVIAVAMTAVGLFLMALLLIAVGAGVIAFKSRWPARSVLFGTIALVLVTVVGMLGLADEMNSLEAGFGLILLVPIGGVLSLIGGLVGAMRAGW